MTIEPTLSVSNSRKSHDGKKFEIQCYDQIERILSDMPQPSGITARRLTKQSTEFWPVSPDILISYQGEPKIFLGCKTSLRERYTQDAWFAEKAKNLYGIQTWVELTEQPLMGKKRLLKPLVLFNQGHLGFARFISFSDKNKGLAELRNFMESFFLGEKR
jgi:hypothetical protein